MTVRPRDHRVASKRVYEPATRGDGVRILVDRLWPRGLRKVEANIDQWRKDLSPSTALRQFYGHQPERFAEFSRRYRGELRRREAAAAVTEMVELNRRRPVTFLTASRDLEHSEAAVLAKHVRTTARRRAQASQREGAEFRAVTSNPNRKGTDTDE